MRSSQTNFSRAKWTFMPIFLALSCYGFAFNVAADDAKPESARITKDQAAQSAVTAVPGTVGEVTIEKKGGKDVYVVEITEAKGGEETDVLVDMDSGKVLGTER